MLVVGEAFSRQNLYRVDMLMHKPQRVFSCPVPGVGAGGCDVLLFSVALGF